MCSSIQPIWWRVISHRSTSIGWRKWSYDVIRFSYLIPAAWQQTGTRTLSHSWQPRYPKCWYVWIWPSRILYYCIFWYIMGGRNKLASITCRNDLENNDLTTTTMDWKTKIEFTHALSNPRYFDSKFNQIRKKTILLERSSIECCKTKTTEKSQRPISRNESAIKNQWQLKIKTSNPSKAGKTWTTKSW